MHLSKDIPAAFVTGKKQSASRNKKQPADLMAGFMKNDNKLVGPSGATAVV
jgi:hypothetical protein